MKITLNLASIKRLEKMGQRKHNAFFVIKSLQTRVKKPSKLKIHFAVHGGSAVYGTKALKEKRTCCDQKGTSQAAQNKHHHAKTDVTNVK